MILAAVTIAGWVIFYRYQRFGSPIYTNTLIPSPAAVEPNMQQAFRYVYKHCLPFFQGSPDNPVILGDKTAMRSLLTPYGTVQLAYDDSGEKGCFEVVINNGVTGTVYFVIDSPEGMKVAAVKWQPGL